MRWLPDSGPDTAFVTVVPMTDAVKEVDENGAVVASLDRSGFGVTAGPAAFGRAVLTELLSSRSDGEVVELVDNASHGFVLSPW
jgi:2-C-methyl-D-erythritol 4-phosphate cytidylyltransferase